MRSGCSVFSRLRNIEFRSSCPLDALWLSQSARERTVHLAITSMGTVMVFGGMQAFSSQA